MKPFAALLLSLVVFMQAQGGEPATPESSKIKALSFVALAEPTLPDATRIRAALQQRLGSMRIDDMESDDQKVILFRIRGGTVMIGLMDLPLPKGEIDHMCKWAWHWRAACDVMASHKAHLTISVLDTNLDKVDAALLQTHVVAALMDSNALASYWRTSLQPKEAFLKQSAGASRENLPVWLWVNFRLTSDVEKGWTISTDGLETFGLYEIESKDANVPGRQLFGLAIGMADYLLKKGPIIKDGETIGDSPAANIRVRHAPSYWQEGKTAYRIVFPK